MKTSTTKLTLLAGMGIFISYVFYMYTFYILAIVAGTGMLVSYALYKHVPEGFPQPWKYRIVVTMMQTFQSINYIKMCVRDRHCPNVFEDMVDFIDQMKSKVPTPPEKFPGSNIRSRVRSFDGIRVRVYEPIERGDEGDLPAFLYFHGGGMTVGSIDMFDSGARMISERLNAVGVAVSYRLAPEHKFPAGFDDALTATKWFLRHVAEFGVDPKRVALIGDSAGAYLSALVAGAISDEPSLPDIKLQILIYPWLQHFDFNTPSMQRIKCQKHKFGQVIDLINLAPYFFTAYALGVVNEDLSRRVAANEHTSAEFKQSPFYKKHLNHDLIPADMKPACYVPPTSDDFGDGDLWESMKDVLTSPKFSPLYLEDFSKLPRAFITTCGYDCKRDDGIFYAKRLENAGVPVKWVDYKVGYHGMSWYGAQAGELGRQIANDFIKYAKDHL